MGRIVTDVIYHIFIYRIIPEEVLMQSFLMQAHDIMSTDHFGTFQGDVNSVWHNGVNIPVGSSAVIDGYKILVMGLEY